jgi:hypothetical protein
MSPEQAAGQAALVPASDVYSLGTTLYSLLTGVAPFPEPREASLREVLEKVRHGQFRRPRQIQRTIAPALEAICLKAMALQPEDRYASAGELVTDLEHWLADEPVAAYREPWLGRLRRWGRRHRLLVTGLAAALVVGLAGLTVGLVVVTGLNRRLDATNADWYRRTYMSGRRVSDQTRY